MFLLSWTDPAGGSTGAGPKSIIIVIIIVMNHSSIDVWYKCYNKQ